MKKLILLMLGFALSAFAQNPFVKYEGSAVKFYDESGNDTTRIGTGDTLVTQGFDIGFYDEIMFSFAPGQLDTAHFSIYVQLGGGYGATTTGGQGFYANGWDAAIFVDSANFATGRALGYAGGSVFPNLLRRAYDVTSVSADSTIYNYGLAGNDLKTHAHKVRFVLIGHLDFDEDTSNTTLLNQCVVIQRRTRQ